MKVVAVIPVKLNSERVPGKNIREFYDGTPLCKLIFDTISSSEVIDESYCFCSDDRIVEFLPENIGFLKRSESLDKSTTTMNEILASFISKVDSDIYVLANVATPFVKPSTISVCVNAVRSSEYDSALSVEALHDFLWVDGKPFNYNPEDIARTQDLPIIYKETTGIYVFTKDLFLKHNRRVGYGPYLHEVGLVEGTDIDYLEDFEVADAIYKDIVKGLGCGRHKHDYKE